MNSPDNPTAFGRFVAEMKRRHVVRFAIGYAAAAFVVLQLGEIVFPAFGLGEQWLRVLVIAVTIGFPPALILAWVFDITPEGLQRTADLPSGEAGTALLPRLALMGFTVVVVGGLAVWLGGSVDPASRGGGTADALDLAAYDPSQPIRSLAVLPLRNESEGADGPDYFTAGLQEELLTRLGQIPGLRVASRTSTERFASASSDLPTLGQELNVDAIIEGAVLRVGDQVRINVTLYHAASETRRWGDSFTGSIDDVFALQAEVALEIARAVQTQVSAEDESMLQRTAARDVDPDATEAYLRGRFEADKGTAEGYRAAVALFQRAVAEDRDFAPALAGLAGSRFLLSLEAPDLPGADVEQAHAEARMALEMDSSSWEAREVLGYIERSMPARPLGAPEVGTPRSEAGARRGGARTTVISVPGIQDSIVIDVGGMDSTWVASMSRMGQRIEEQMLRHVTARGGAVGQRVGAAQQLMHAGLFDAAVDVLEGVVREHPEDVRAWTLLAHATVSDGDADDAVDILRDWAASGAAGAPTGAEVARLADAVDEDGDTAYWRWLEARLSADQRAGRLVSMTDLATALAGAGRTDQALDALMAALKGGEPGVHGVRNDPAWDDLRDDRRLVEIMRETQKLRRARPPTPPSGAARPRGGDRRE